ncbi:MAG: hypothetical protein V7676_13730 [Parasphingorhabdus sp.]|uniref:hypothetical protein n=1 Tax=Parasphingorhabdus sp. TaxID=2709688 RepID=UPI003001763E
MTILDKDHPSAEWINDLRRRFEIEAQIDKLLTRKMELHSGPGYSSDRLEDLLSGLDALLKAKIGSGFKLHKARWLSGGASKLQMAFDLEWN